MRRLVHYRPSPAIVIACIALAIALGGTSYAAVVIPRNSVGTLQLKNNAVTSLKVQNRSLRAADFAVGQLPRGPRGLAGPAGPAGTAGPTGPSGPAGASASGLWGVVTSDGGTSRGSGVTTTTKLSGSGHYSVRFNRAVNTCAWVASVGSPGSGTNNGTASTELTSSVNDTISVSTFNLSGSAADRPFHIAVFCPA